MTRPRRKFNKLKNRMGEFEVIQKDLAPLLEHPTQTYLTNRMTAQYPFTMNDVYTICDYLEIPYGEIAEYFPKGGISKNG